MANLSGNFVSEMTDNYPALGEHCANLKLNLSLRAENYLLTAAGCKILGQGKQQIVSPNYAVAITNCAHISLDIYVK